MDVRYSTHTAGSVYDFPVLSKRENVPSIVIFFITVGSGAESKASKQLCADSGRKRLTIGQVLLFDFTLDAVHHLVDRRAV